MLFQLERLPAGNNDFTAISGVLHQIALPAARLMMLSMICSIAMG